MSSSSMVRAAGMTAVALALLFPTPLLGQEGAPCSDSVHSAFDFWVGTWEVRLADGSLAGHNTIRKRSGGCVLAEEWSGTSGSVGRSLNFVDPVDRRWRQVWVDDSGLALRLAGGPYEGGIRLQGRGNDTTRLQQVTWTPMDDGRVRQHWRVSSDEGESWSDVFDGFYARLPTAETAEVGSDRCDTPQGRRFDFWPGEWRVESRLRDAEGEWHQTEHVWRAERVLDGCGFLDFTTGDYGDGSMSGVGSRFYDPDADHWIITWTSTQAPGRLGVWEGRFGPDGTGEFFRETETPNGTVRSRIRWMNVRSGAADWDYAVSRNDGGDWQVAWEMRFRSLVRSKGG